jgi:hypothetical protein
MPKLMKRKRLINFRLAQNAVKYAMQLCIRKHIAVFILHAPVIARFLPVFHFISSKLKVFCLRLGLWVTGDIDLPSTN